MFNLLPKAEKDSIRREYRMRLMIVWLWFLLLTLLIASALLIPSYLLLVQKEREAGSRAELLRQNGFRDEAASSTALLQATQEKLALAASSPPPRYFFERIAAAAQKKPSRISLHGFSAVPTAGEKHSFFLSGVAAERAVLVSFAQLLEDAGVFTEVEVPLPLLAKENGIEFTLRAAGTF